MAWDRNPQPRPQARAWEYWSMRLKKAGEYPAGRPRAARQHQARREIRAARRAAKAAAGTSGASAAQSDQFNQCE
jgi:hypothetical protein